MPPAPLIASTSLRRLHLNVVTAVGFVMALVAMALILRMSLWPWIAASVGTAAMVRWTVAWATRVPSSRGQIIGRTLSIAAFMGVLNVGVAFSLASIAELGQPIGIALVPFAMVAGSPVGLSFGFMFGLWLCIPAAALMTTTTRPSPSASDLSIAVLGLWASCTAALCLLPEPGKHTIYDIAMGPPSAAYFPVLLAAITTVGALGTTLAVLGGGRWLERIYFVRQATKGERPHFSTTVIPEGHDVSGLPVLGGDEATCTHALMRHEQTGETYRGTAFSRAIARFPGSWLEPAPHE